MSDRSCEWPGCKNDFSVARVVGTGEFYCSAHGKQRSRELAKEMAREKHAKLRKLRAARALQQAEPFVRSAHERVRRNRIFDLDDD